LYYVDKGRVS